MLDDVMELFGTADTMYALISAAFVFFMQAGFALLENGSIRKKN